MKDQSPTTERVELKIPFVTLLKICLFALGVLAIAKLVPLILLCFLGLLLAVSAEPIIFKLEKFIPRWLSIILLMTVVVSVITGLVLFISPPFYEQAGRIIQKAPGASASLLNHLPPSGPLHRFAEKLVSIPTPNAENWGPRLLTAGQMAFGALTSLILVLVLMAYLLFDGRNTWAWILAFFKLENRRKLQRTANEITPVISAYIVGQIITSLLCGLAVFVMLKSLGVPAAVVLAVLAAVLDVLPIVGFIMTMVPAVLFALTVSPSAALSVFFLFGAYHTIENYVIVPWVYGNRLRVSGLVILIAILAGVALGGILGGILILPVVASYPIIEKIWLAEYVGSRVIAKHRAIENDETPVLTPATHT